jgi:hypothetical protein
MIWRCVIATSLFLVHCGSSASSSGGGDASDVEGSSSGGGSSSSGGGSSSSGGGSSSSGGGSSSSGAGPVVDGAAEDGSLAPSDGGLDDHSTVGDTSGDSGPGSCLGSVMLRLVAGSSGARYCENMPCEFANLVSVVGPGGQMLTTSRESNGCFLVDCAGCAGGGCSGACPAATPLPDGGVALSWDGTVWTSGKTCGSNMACSAQICAPAGQYTAHMCAYRAPDAGGCFGGAISGPPVCVDVPFAYPAQGSVVGSLP